MESITRELRKLAFKNIYFHPVEIEEEDFLAKPEDVVIEEEMIKDNINEDIKLFICAS